MTETPSQLGKPTELPATPDDAVLWRFPNPPVGPAFLMDGMAPRGLPPRVHAASNSSS